MEKDEARFEAMQMNLNETNAMALKGVISRLDRLESNIDSFIEDFVEHINGEDDDDDDPFKGKEVKLSGVGRFKI